MFNKNRLNKFKLNTNKLSFKKILTIIMIVGLSIAGINHFTNNYQSKAVGVNSITPDSGYIDGGEKVTITGDFSTDKTITKIVSSDTHSLAIDNNGVLYAWGDDYNGQIGDGTLNQYHGDNEFGLDSVIMPLRITGKNSSQNPINNSTVIVDIAVGSGFSLALDDQGNLYGWGLSSGLGGCTEYGWYWDWESDTNEYGCHNEGSYSDGEGYKTPILINHLNNPNLPGIGFQKIFASDRDVFAIDYNNELWVWGEYKNETLMGLSSIKDVAVGDRYGHFLAVNYSGQVYAWGLNKYGQLGDNKINGDNVSVPILVNGLNNIESVAIGSGYSMALDRQGNIFAWGRNWSGEVGNGQELTGCGSNSIDRYNGVDSGYNLHQVTCTTPIQINGNPDSGLPADIKMKKIAAYSGTSFAIDTDGKLWSWGEGYTGGMPLLSEDVPVDYTSDGKRCASFEYVLGGSHYSGGYGSCVNKPFLVNGHEGSLVSENAFIYDISVSGGMNSIIDSSGNINVWGWYDKLGNNNDSCPSEISVYNDCLFGTINSYGDFVGSNITVLINNKECENVIVAADKQSLTCTTPENSAGTYDVVITDNLNTPAILSSSYTYSDVLPCDQSECFAFTVDTRLQADGATTGTDTTFSIPLSGMINNINKVANWIIDWGDGTTSTPGPITGSTSHAGITHDYASTGGAGEYQIAIRPNGTATDGWFNAFGFYFNNSGANGYTNKYKFRSIDTPFTDLMRTKNSTSRFAYIFCDTVNGIEIPANLFSNIDTSTTTDFSNMFNSTFYGYAQNSTVATIPADLFSSINTTNGVNFAYMFSETFYAYAINSDVATIPADLFSSIDTTNGINFRSMFNESFSCFAYEAPSVSGIIPGNLFESIKTNNGTNFQQMFENTFSKYAKASTHNPTIPNGLFDSINTVNGSNFTRMFYHTFNSYAYSSTLATIPNGLFDSINTINGSKFEMMFYCTFYYYAYDSTSGTVPEGLFDSIDTTNGTNFTDSWGKDDTMFGSIFSGYAGRTAKFSIKNNQIISSSIFSNPYSVKIGSDGIPGNPSINATTGSQVIPTYNTSTRSISVPAAYKNYIFYYKDGTSCEVSDPTPDCGPQDSTTQYTGTWPNTSEWTTTTSTEKGNVTFYGVEPTITLTLDNHNPILKDSLNNSTITPTSSGTYASASNTANVITNNVLGYSLSISTDKPSTDTNSSNMEHLSLPGNYLLATNNTCTWNNGTKTLTNTTTALSNNTWGFTLNNTNLTNQQLCRVPNSSNPLTVKSTTTQTDQDDGDDTTIYYGSKIDTNQVAGQYEARILYTGVVNI